MLFVDGSANVGGRGAGLVFAGPDKFLVEYALKLDFDASNNEAEYEALLAGLALALELEADRLKAHSDSILVVGHINGLYEAKDRRILKYLEKVGGKISLFKEFKIVQISRTLNARADALSKMASSKTTSWGNVYNEVLSRPRIEREEVTHIDHEPSWMEPIIQYLKDGTLPEDIKEAWRITAKSTLYILKGEVLYKRSFSWPLLKCLRPTDADRAMAEVHEDICGGHSGGKVLAHKILRRGFFWSTILEDAQNYVKKCEQCQKFSLVPRQPATPYSPISSPIPFVMWGMDLLGPFPPSVGGHTMLYVSIDYFTKWVEAKAVKKATSEATETFFLSRHYV
ncbi:uncharacterized protein LOC143852409 [Tasmannia lanceolata]|uniref:uncharacterized protein LOC143852409 n=1 Tax=Tasmannia lanceolata TaxID=3420 RepID=UPI0040628C36